MLADIVAADELEVMTELYERPRSRVDQNLLGHMTAAGLVRVINGCAQEIAQLEAMQYRAIAGLNVVQGGSRGVATEVAIALDVTGNWAASMVSHAEALTTRLPQTLGLMDQGKINAYKASKVCEATGWLSDDKAAEVDEALSMRLEGKDPSAIRKAAYRAANKVDPEGAAKRTKERRESRRLRLIQGESGAASLSLDECQAEKVIAAYNRIDRAARKLKSKDEPRTLDQLRADVALDLLLSANGGPGPKAEVFLYVDLLTYAGLNDDPAEIAGHGTIPAALARHIASGADSVLRRIITDPLTGQILELGRTRYRPTAALTEYIQVRDRECRGPGCHRPAQYGDGDHSPGWANGCDTGASTIVGLCRREHRIKDEPRWRHDLADDGTLTITTPAGQVYQSAPEPLHDPRPTETPPF
jgi:hypothetical protein